MVLIVLAIMVFRHPLGALIGLAIYLSVSLLFIGITQILMSIAAKGDRLTLPIDTGVIKVAKFGKLTVKISMIFCCYAAFPDTFGPQHQTRIQIVPVVQLPW